MTQAALSTLLFYMFAAGMTVFALLTVFARSLLYAAVSLIAVLILTAGLYILLHAEFLAGVQVLVYVGGIVVLIVFVIMLTRGVETLEDAPARGRIFAGTAMGLAMFILSCAVILSPRPDVQAEDAFPADNVREIGKSLLDYGPAGYVLPFEIISLLLLAAALGGIVLARKIPAPEQPFTSGGDLESEVTYVKPNAQPRDDAS